MIYTIDQSQTSSGCNNFLKKYKSFSHGTRYFGGIRPVGKAQQFRRLIFLTEKVRRLNCYEKSGIYKNVRNWYDRSYDSTFQYRKRNAATGRVFVEKALQVRRNIVKSSG